jgi:hypothetical protein
MDEKDENTEEEQEEQTRRATGRRRGRGRRKGRGRKLMRRCRAEKGLTSNRVLDFHLQLGMTKVRQRRAKRTS